MDLTDPKDYPIGTRGKREQDDYKAVYGAAKGAEAIDANTDQLESLIGTTNSRLNTIDSHIDQVEGKLDTLITATSTLVSSLSTIIEKLETIATNTTPVEPGE